MGKYNKDRPSSRRIRKTKLEEAAKIDVKLAGDEPDEPENDLDDDIPFDLTGGREPKEGEHRVTLLRDHSLDYPELWMEVHVHCPLSSPQSEARGFAEMFARASCKKATSPDKADLVVFVGGQDVDPALYGEKPHHRSNFSVQRDTDDINMYLYCLTRGIPMVGICRGAQFLNVMNGGKNYQDVDNHFGDHSGFDAKMKTTVERISSVHHQAVRSNVAGGMEILMTSAKSRHRILNPTESEVGIKADIEAFFYRETCCLGIQGHPEYRGYNFFAIWALKQIEACVILNPDLDWDTEDKKFRRMRADLLEQRTIKPEDVEGVFATIKRGV